ncbi:odorant receptor 56a-like [Chironomus tepperi]|uniref:odorant receptor 56a-like n=1 Tax=Chironomus tepperi TaxID=113505 RepID=UPI00391FAD30
MIDIEKFVFKSNVENNPLIGVQLTAMKYFGYMIFEHQRLKRLHCFRGVVFTTTFILFNLAQYVDLFTKINDVNELAKNASTTLLFTTTSFRMINFYWNRTRYVNLIKEVDKNLVNAIKFGDYKIQDIIAKYIKYLKRLTAIFWIIALITANGMCVKSIIEGIYLEYQVAYNNFNSTDIEAPLILPCWFPFDDYWNKFWIIFGIEYYIMNVGMLIVPCWHSFIVSMMGYVIINLKILNFKLSEMNLKNLPNIELIKCVEHRERLVCFIRELSSLISSSLFLDFIIFSLLLCMLLFQASQVGDGIQLGIIACYIITMTTILWMYYYHSNEITYYTDQLSSSSYSSSWYKHSQSFKKQMLIFMMSAKPIMLRAGFIDMKLDTFLNILRASYSYFTLLTQMAAK